MDFVLANKINSDDIEIKNFEFETNLTFLPSKYLQLRGPLNEQIVKLHCSTFFDLHIFEIYSSDFNLSAFFSNDKVSNFSRSIFILSEKFKNWIPVLLSQNAFDVMLAPIRQEELIGKIEFFFSDQFQTSLMKLNCSFELDLTKKEQKLFDFLISYPKGVTRDQLMNICWKNISVHPKTLDVHLFNLRQKLEPFGGEICFKNGCWNLILKNSNYSNNSN